VFRIITDKKYRILCIIIAISGVVLLLSSLVCRIILIKVWADVNNDLSEFIFSTFVVLVYIALFAILLSVLALVALFLLRMWRGRK
jgi:amino acid permease